MRVTNTIVLGLLALAACGESTSEPERSTSEGAIEFSFSGDRSGRFVAHGEPLTGSEEAVARDVAGARINGTEPQTTQIYAIDYSRPPLAETFALTLMGPPGTLKPGTYPLRAAGCNIMQELCVSGIRMVAGVNLSAQQYEAVYGMVSGTVTITTASATRLRGTFSALREATALEGGLSIAQGTFDVALQ